MLNQFSLLRYHYAHVNYGPHWTLLTLLNKNCGALEAFRQ